MDAASGEGVESEKAPVHENAIAAGRAFCRITFSRNLFFFHLETFFAGLAKFNLTNPLRLENLSGCKTTGGMGVQNGVNDISTTSLWNKLIQILGRRQRKKTASVTYSM